MPSLSSPQIKTTSSALPSPYPADPAPPSQSIESKSSHRMPSTYPDPQIFTFLPDLYLLISRLKDLRDPPPTAIATNDTGLTQIPSRESAVSGRSLSNDEEDKDKTIEVRELPAQVYAIRRAIASAKEVVSALPDVERSVEEQEGEMRELRAEVAGLRGRLRELGEIAGRGRGGDVDMKGVGEG